MSARLNTGGDVSAFDPDYYATAFSTIASLAERCLDETGAGAHDILWAIQKMSEGFDSELRAASVALEGGAE